MYIPHEIFCKIHTEKKEVGKSVTLEVRMKYNGTQIT
jgi:hypothetical protein